MTWSSSYVAAGWLSDAISVGHTYNYSTDVFKIALFTNAASPTAGLSLANQVYSNATYWPSGNECSGGSWSSGGYTLGAATITNQTGVSTGDVTVAWSNVSQTTSTISTGFYGGCVYDHTVNSAANYILCAVYFGGSYTVGGGTLAINWGNDGNSNACVFYITG
jgi:hypothetical protein